MTPLRFAHGIDFALDTSGAGLGTASGRLSSAGLRQAHVYLTYTFGYMPTV